MKSPCDGKRSDRFAPEVGRSNPAGLLGMRQCLELSPRVGAVGMAMSALIAASALLRRRRRSLGRHMDASPCCRL